MTQKEINHNFYIKRKESGLCITCGEPVDKYKLYCNACRKKHSDSQKQDRAFMKTLGICPRCGKVRLFGDEKNCPECRAKATRYASEWRMKNGERYNSYMRDYSKNLYQQRLEKGLCVRCGKKALEGYKMCGICREKDRQRKKLQYSPKFDRKQDGICYRCGNPIEDSRYKLCNRCVEQNRINRKG